MYTSKKLSRKSPKRKSPKRKSRKPLKRNYKTTPRKTSRRRSRKTSRRMSRKTSIRRSRKTSIRRSRKTSRRRSIKTSRRRNKPIKFRLCSESECSGEDYPKIVIYTIEGCVYCEDLKTKLKSKHIKYEEIDASIKENVNNLLKIKNDAQGVPVFFLQTSLNKYKFIDNGYVLDTLNNISDQTHFIQKLLKK